MPPSSRPFPRFIADSQREGNAYGRFEDRLVDAFLAGSLELERDAGEIDPATIRWFPDRSWGGRTFIPVTARAEETEGGPPVEFFGHVSFVRTEEGGIDEVRVAVDYTDVTAEDNPDWKIDLNDDVIGEWRSDGGRGGEVTLIWGLPLVRGALAATAELDGETVDQAPVHQGRFTLIAVDAVRGFGDELFLDICLWNRRLAELARESLYDETGDEDEEDESATAGEGEAPDPVDLAEGAGGERK